MHMLNRKTRTALAGFARLLPILFAPLLSCGQNPFTLWYWNEGGLPCNAQYDGYDLQTYGCCGSPGRRECNYVINWDKFFDGSGCTDPDQNIIRPDTYNHNKTVCNLGDVPIVFPAYVPDPDNVTFYVGADYHVFRTDFDPYTQAYFPRTLGQFAKSKAPWPGNAGIPTGDTVDPPLALVIAGDMTTGAGVEQLAAYRTVWEGNTLNGGWSFPYPVYPGLGNHDVLNAGTGGAGSPGDAQRMWDYLGSAMLLFNMDNSSQGLLGVNDGQGTHNYSWDWGGVHYVQLNTWAGEYDQYNAPGVNGLQWLANDLAQNVGNSAKPVILFQHYDLSTLGDLVGDLVHDSAENVKPPVKVGSWWTVGDPSPVFPYEYNSFWNVIRDYNVIGTFCGHVHAWDMQRPEHYTEYWINGAPDGSLTIPNTDSDGNTKIYDVFRAAPLGFGNFYTVRVTPDYLDVAAWALPGSPLLAPQPISSSPMWGHTPACRKRINTKYVDVSGLVSIQSASAGYTVQNNSQFDIPGPLALKVATTHGNSNLGTGGSTPGNPVFTNRSFVDSCDPYFGDAYVLLAPSSLAPNQSVTVTVENVAWTWFPEPALTLLEPLGSQGGILANPASLSLQGSNPPPQNVYYYSPQGATPLPPSITYQGGGVTGWLSWTSIPGTGGASGGYNLTFDSDILGQLIGSSTANFTITSASGDSVTIPVTVTVTVSYLFSASSISFASSPTQKLTVTSSNPNVSLPFYLLGQTEGFTVSPTTGNTPATLTLTVSDTPLGPPGDYPEKLSICSSSGCSAAPAVSATIPVNISVEQLAANATGGISNIPITVDHVTYTGTTGPLNLVTGTVHNLSTQPTWQANSFEQDRFVNWACGGNESTQDFILVTIPAYGAPLLCQADFNPWELLSLGEVPANGGSMELSPPSPENYYAKGASVTVTAVPNAGYYFQHFEGLIKGFQSPALFTLAEGGTVTGLFATTNGAGQTTITTVPPGAGIQVNYEGQDYTTPATFYWAANQTFTVTVPPQQTTTTTQLGFVSWNDGNTSATRNITGINGGAQTFTATLATQYMVKVTAVPSNAGTTAGAGFVTTGTSTTLTASPAPGFRFAGFTGDVNSQQNGVTIQVSKPLYVQANFTAVSVPNITVLPGNAVLGASANEVDLALTMANGGPGPAGDLTITGVDGFQNLIGTGAEGSTVFYGTPMPVYVGTVFPGKSINTTISLVWPPTATRMQFVVHFSANGGAYTGSTTLNVFR